MPRPGIGETLKAVGQKKTRKQKLDALADGYRACGPLMVTLLKYTLKPNIVFRLPEGAPPYRSQAKNLDLQNMLYAPSTMRLIKLMMLGGTHPNLKRDRVEQKFIELLESLDPDDAELIVLMKDKKLPKGVTKDLIQEVFSVASKDWFPPEEKKDGKVAEKS